MRSRELAMLPHHRHWLAVAEAWDGSLRRVRAFPETEAVDSLISAKRTAANTSQFRATRSRFVTRWQQPKFGNLAYC
jgi:hypothetical protein